MPQKFLSIKNFEKYQTSCKYPKPWVKLYKSILADPEFMKLSTHHRFLYTGLILLADECGNKIYNDSTYLGQRLYIPSTEVDLKPLYRAGFLIASNMSRCVQELEIEKKREELEIEKEIIVVNGLSEFETFWQYYPKKVGKKEACKAWEKAKDRPEIGTIILSLDLAKQSEQWKKDNGQFIPNPSTWLNQGRWADEPVKRAPSVMEAFLSRGDTDDPLRIR